VPYNNLTDRTDAGPLTVPEQVIQDIMNGVRSESAALSFFHKVSLSSKTSRLPVLSALPTAYWVSGDTGLKQTTELAWGDKDLVVEEIAVIVPVPEAVIDDADFDLWAEIKPLVSEAVGRALDAAIYFGTNAPASWTDANLVAKAVAAGNAYARGTNGAAAGGLGEDINQMMGLVEDDGFDVSGFYTSRSYKKRLRGARDTTGQKLLDVSTSTLEGVPIWFGMPGLWPTGLSAAELVAGDFSQGIIGVRQDLTFKVLDQAVITDAGGLVVYNLPQQDMLALRVVARYAFAVANPITHERPVEADRYPFSVLRSPAV
jgi:HK97 family phage major capsid protein